MKFAGFLCGCAPGRGLPRDHYSSGACPDPPFSPEWIDAIIDYNEGDDLHRDGRITPTRVIGCPRQSILLDSKPAIVDLARLHSAAFGHDWHAILRERAKGELTEVRMPETTIFGVPMSGRADLVRRDYSEIIDYKTHGETAQRMKWERRCQGLPDRELAAQLNLYRIMIARSVLKVPDEEYKPRLIGWHMAMVGAKRGPGEPVPARKSQWNQNPPPPCFKVIAPIMTEDEIGRIRPFDNESAPGTQPYTIREIVAQYVAFRKAIAEGVGFDQALRTHVPLVGRGIWGGKMCTRYCAALGLCDEVEGITR